MLLNFSIRLTNRLDKKGETVPRKAPGNQSRFVVDDLDAMLIGMLANSPGPSTNCQQGVIGEVILESK